MMADAVLDPLQENFDTANDETNHEESVDVVESEQDLNKQIQELVIKNSRLEGDCQSLSDNLSSVQAELAAIKAEKSRMESDHKSTIDELVGENMFKFKKMEAELSETETQMSQILEMCEKDRKASDGEVTKLSIEIISKDEEIEILKKAIEDCELKLRDLIDSNRSLTERLNRMEF